MKSIHPAFCMMVSLLLPLAACSTTQVDSVDLQKNKLMVVALATRPELRANFEDALAAKLLAGGIAAISSHALLPVLDSGAREAIVRIAHDNAVTAVVAIAASTVDRQGELTELGLPAPDTGGQLGAFVAAAIRRGEIREGHVVFVTRVYRLATEALVWGGVSWAQPVDGADALIDETTSIIAANIVNAERQLLEVGRSRARAPER
jgi:hypothetical protein